jgi:hypothetical protein
MSGRTKKWLQAILAVVFQTVIVLALLTRVFCIRDTQDYEQLQPELKAPDVIATVLHKPDLGQIYVCYNDASYVNVYTEDGTFLWAVSTPYLRNVYFTIRDEKLIIYNGDAYVYDAADGSFLELSDMSHDTEGETTGEFEAGAFYYDAYQVYRGTANGEVKTIVSRPWWYILTNFVVCWCIAFACAMGFLALRFFDKIRAWWSVRREVQFDSKKARVILAYLRTTSVLHILFAAAVIIAAIYHLDISIGLMAVGIHFIVSNWVIWNILDRIDADADQQKVLRFWKAFEFATFVAAFFSVVVAGVILGNI